jgi:4a-hydroxytetrahydrobiopterin dehydratase
MDIHEKSCVPCEGGTEPLTEEQEKEYAQLVPDWSVDREGVHSISRLFRFRDFKETMAFADRVGEIAEQEGHHPDMHVSYGKLMIELSTHAIQGLSENDFILAAKIDRLK